MKGFATVLLVLAAGSLAPGLGAQEAPPGEPPRFEDVLYPPELIMQHRRAIELSDRQRDAISQHIEDLQGRIVRLQWELADQMDELTGALRQPRVDLDLALDRLEAALETEKRIKQAHLEALIRIKNVLRREQQAELDRLRERRPGPEDEPG